jgi:DivIVA domain-containing protein
VPVSFAVVLRGYDRTEVDLMVRRVNEALASDDLAVRASVSKELRECAFPVRLRGYDRIQVDEYLRHAASRLA